MGKIAFVFAGQGAQYSGMGLDLTMVSPAAAKVFNTLDIIHPGTSYQCFSGDSKALRDSKNSHPCLFAVDMACAAALNDIGVKADMVAGYSVGEMAALAYSGAIDIPSAFRLVHKRSSFMHKAAEFSETSLFAVTRLSNEKVKEICSRFTNVYPICFNCPGQVLVSGLKEALPEFVWAVKEAGGKLLPMKNCSSYHSPFMLSASMALAGEAAKYHFNRPNIPVYSNYTGEAYPADIKKMPEYISRQVSSPVLWERNIRNMILTGADTFIILGPSQILGDTIRKINPAVRIYTAADVLGLNTILQEVC
ncbi:MAG: ACP S-malonyltransferase [Ruminococcaceae bacterium]|nr:ACP S-malonyltransferase [Oscillospiraceae bacterium]